MTTLLRILFWICVLMLVKLVSVITKSAIVETFLNLIKEVTLVLPFRCLRCCHVPCGGEVLISYTFEVTWAELLTNTRYLVGVLTELHLHVWIGVFCEDLGRTLSEIWPRNRLPWRAILARQFNAWKFACWRRLRLVFKEEIRGASHFCSSLSWRH